MSKELLKIGWAQKDITPEKPVMLSGQFYVRVSTGVQNPITATALALEGSGDAAVLVSCDLVGIPLPIVEQVREKVKKQLPDLDGRKIMMSVTHTHTAPVTMDGMYPEQSGDCQKPSEYAKLMTDRMAEAIVEAWNNRSQGGISRAFGHAVAGHNRRTVYADGRAQMYGETNAEDFHGLEGYQDHSVDMLFTWDVKNKLTGMLINLACPSQVTEHLYEVSADYWHETREELHKRYGEHIFVVGQCGAAGDQSPRFPIYKRVETWMREQKGVSDREEIAERIANAVDYVMPIAEKNATTDVDLVHVTEDITLIPRTIAQWEVDRANRNIETRLARKSKDDTAYDGYVDRQKEVQKRFDRQDKVRPFTMELHVLRIGDIAMATNPFELYLDFALRIKARSRAPQTFVTQLACGVGGYLPTERAVQGGHYGAEPMSNNVGPEGGQELVEKTLKVIDSLWKVEK